MESTKEQSKCSAKSIDATRTAEFGTNTGKVMRVCRCCYIVRSLLSFFFLMHALFQTVSSEEEVLLRFSMKESLYKAMHPYLCHYVGFQQVEIQPTAEGQGHVQLLFPTQLGPIHVYWQRMGPYFLSSCRVYPNDQ